MHEVGRKYIKSFGRGNGNQRNHLEDNIKVTMEGFGLHSCSLGQGKIARSCKQGNEPSGSVKFRTLVH
jgi:hypothetical protein